MRNGARREWQRSIAPCSARSGRLWGRTRLRYGSGCGPPRDGTLGDGSARGTGGRNSGRGHSPAGADAGRVSAFGWETIAGKASWRGSDDYVSTSLVQVSVCTCMCMSRVCTGTAHDARRHVTSPGFRGSPRAQRESRYSPSSKGVRGPSGLRPARPAVNIHSFSQSVKSSVTNGDGSGRVVCGIPRGAGRHWLVVGDTVSE